MREDALRSAASGNPSSPEAEKLSKKLAEAQEVANSGDWRARHAGATDGYNAAAAAYGEYVDANWKALAAEVEAEATLSLPGSRRPPTTSPQRSSRTLSFGAR